MGSAREELEVRTADGVARASVFRGGDGPLPGVVLFVDAFGVRPSMEEAASRLAALGYVVLLPNLFYRAGAIPPFDIATAFGDPPERARLMALIQSITLERLRTDTAAYLDALAAQRDVRADRLGTIGYCMGGRLAYLAAALHPDRVRAVACFHGGGLVTDAPESPHRLALQVKAALYLGVADEDRGCTPEHQAALAAALGAAHLDYAVELYRGKRHGFAVADHAGAYDRDAAERHWRRVASFFAETLR
jgi:carboxymethylenebutenolidase